jgi:MFS transporter, DHA1 family, inner membrane transport protein
MPWLFLALSFLMDLVTSLVAGALPWVALRADLGPTELGVVAGSRMFAYFLVAPWSGRLSDRYDARWLAALGALLAAAGAFAVPEARGLVPLLLASVVAGAGAALFWPPLLGWLPGQAGKDLPRALAAFNVAWSLGAMLGAAGYGRLLEWSTVLLYRGAAVAFLIVAVGVLLLAPPRRKPSAPASAGETSHMAGPTSAALPLPLYWTANAVAWLGFGVLADLYPTLARAHGFGPSVTSALLGLAVAGRVAAFVVAPRITLAAPVTLMIVLAALAGAILLPVSAAIAVVAAGFFGVGLCTGAAYSISMAASMGTPTPGRSTGWHETLQGAGRFAGPTAGGALIDATAALGSAALRMPYAAVAALALGLLVVAALGQRRSCRSGTLGPFEQPG